MTILFFLIGMVHISFASIGILCIAIPLLQYAKYKEKIWCRYYCPRAGAFTVFLSKISLKKTPPKSITSKKFRKAVLIYFAVNFFFITMSSIMVSLGRIEPIAQIRFLIVFGLPINLPQLLSISAPNVLVHFGYRMYSVMFTSIVIGLVLGFIYKPRIWCSFCPINTLTTTGSLKS